MTGHGWTLFKLKDELNFFDKVDMSNHYRCPTCRIAGLDPKNDNTKKEGDHIVRTLIYECGTVLKIVQTGFRFRSNVKESAKCLERFVPTRLINTG